MKVSVKNGVLFIEVPLGTPTPSASGKPLVVASTRGNMKTGVEVEGKELVLGLNAYIHK